MADPRNDSTTNCPERQAAARPGMTPTEGAGAPSVSCELDELRRLRAEALRIAGQLDDPEGLIAAATQHLPSSARMLIGFAADDLRDAVADVDRARTLDDIERGRAPTVVAPERS